ncbi:hypothetical protein T484DRAFT_1755208 [Baffinella frigidus]|nr:hypothetical protein T484DRAFT_1755208 [Cryptophyta sp. CCMP2293]
MAVASTRLLPGHGGAPRVARTGLAVAAALAVVTLMVASSGQRQMKESVSVSGMERRQVLERKASTQLASEELAHLDHLNAALFPKEDTAHVFSHAAGKSEAANRWIAKHRQDAFTARRAQHKLRAQHTRRAQHKLTALAAAEKHALGDEVLDPKT